MSVCVLGAEGSWILFLEMGRKNHMVSVIFLPFSPVFHDGMKKERVGSKNELIV